MNRPKIAPDLLASMTDGAPSRLVRKLDKKPDLAESWSWSAEEDRWTVGTESGETVTLEPEQGATITAKKQIRCTCLLAPRCLHILATLSRLEVSDDVQQEPTEEEENSVSDETSLEVTEAQSRAASLLNRVGATVLDSGAVASGAVVQAELLRAIHECRAQGLHRAAAAGLRVLRAVRDLRDEKPEFTLETMASDLEELLSTCRMLGAASPGQLVGKQWIGIARRVYQSEAGLQLTGIFSEPIVARSGYAGVVTFLCDRHGTLYTLSDVLPGEPSRVTSAYETAVRLGEATLSHREVSRRGLFIQDATVSADGRLGAGAAVKAVARGVSSWNDSGPMQLWKPSLIDQLHRVRAVRELAVNERSAGSDLLFLKGVVVGLSRDGLIVAVPFAESSPMIELSAKIPSDHEVLAYRDNARQLGRAPGLELLLIGRARLSQPRTIELLAIGQPPLAKEAEGDDQAGDGPALRLPSAWVGRVNLGFDALQGAHLAGVRRSERSFALAQEGSRTQDPVEALRRRIHRLALGGRLTLPPSALPSIDREAAWLEVSMMPTAAGLLRALGDAASSGERSLQGVRSTGDPEGLAEAWLAAATFERAATLELLLKSWLSA